MTIWPASVPVMVEDWPEARSATAKAVEAIGAPRSGASRRCASCSSLTSNCPARWKTAAATMRIAALTKKAAPSAIDRVGDVVAHGLPLVGGGRADVARLHQRGVQVEVVRHHGRAEDAERDVERLGAGQRRHQHAERDAAPVGLGEEDLQSRSRAPRWSPG